ncbi:MAG: hypothetical protein ACI8ZO_000403 [Flavobacteriales bacterium]|jgi:hypothetical protein
MLRKLLALIIFVGAASVAAAQSGTLKGVVTEKSTGESIPTANVIVKQDGQVVNGTVADFDGRYTIKPLNPGTYTIEVSFIGYATQPISGVIISPNKIEFLNISLTKENELLGEVEIIFYEKPLINKDNTGEIKTKSEIIALAQRDVNSLASATAGVYQADDGGDINMRGSRGNATDIYIDGIKVMNANSIPQNAIEQLQVITGGIPARYGDATGGIISITTSGPSRVFRGGAELATSEGLDKFGQSLMALTASGPLIRRKDEDRTPIVGYFLAGEAEFKKDPDPSAIGIWKVKDDVLADLAANPIVAAPSGLGTLQRADLLKKEDFELVSRKPNTERFDLSFSGKFDIKPSANTNITLGGSMSRSDYNSYNFDRQGYNYVENPQYIEGEWRSFARFRQSFKATDESSIKNAYYTLQLDYSKRTRKIQDENLKDNFFEYGYIGKFKTYRDKIYNYGTDDTTGLTGWIHGGYRDTLVTFEASDINPAGTAYTESFFDIVGDNKAGNYENIFQIQQGGGLLNGGSPQSVYSIWQNTGNQFNLYQIVDQSQFRITGMGSADIKDHAVQLGFEFEQRTDRLFGMNPIGTWGLARQYMNRHIAELDLSNPMPVYRDGVYQDTVNYDRLYNGANQATFDENFRASLGKPINGTEFIDVDSYNPEDFDLSMFSADELLNNGNGLVAYYGYDYQGNKLSSRPTVNDFFSKTDETGNFTRDIGAFEPIYVAGYIQDKFAFRDLLFNIGVRVDRYDANQPVLKDPFTLFPAYTVGEMPTGKLASGQSVPGNIGDDYVVYVASNEASDVSILGYRSGSTWFDANGVELVDPKSIAEGSATGQMTPWLVDADKVDPTKDVSAKSFEDYTPQVNFMPRIAFSFPISDEAQFFAHYDVLTQRPSGFSRFDPTGYMFILNQGSTLNNSNLLPETTIDYEVGFKQALNKRSALTISAFYRELRDMVQVTSVNYAHPTTYNTYANIDFGTVKGFSFVYDLRRTGNVQLTANYTLQFADGSGSGSESGLNLINSGQPNLRTILPLDYDQRHAIVTTIDYRYGNKDNYNGPVLGGKKILANAGANFQVRMGSGTPYSKQSNITQDAAFGISQRSILSGNINGARLPFQFRIDARFDKSINFEYGTSKKKANCTVYLQVQNLLDARNIGSVYKFTGNAEDDGYLSSAVAQTAINQQTDPQAFRDQYSIKVSNPNNYTLPRRIRLGVNINF